MTAGHVDRTVLASNYQQPGETYLDTKTEGAFEVLAQQSDDNYDLMAQLMDGESLSYMNAYNLANTGAGDGTINDYAALSALLTVIGALKKTLIISKPFRIGTNITIPSNVTLWFLQGGSLKPDASITITINGSITAGLYQIFTGAGTFVNGGGKIAFSRPEWWGAVTGGVVDCTTAIQSAVDFSKTNYFVNATYLISDTIRERSNGGQRRLIGEGEFDAAIAADASMTNKPLFWFGNSNGHGNYRGKIENITLHGGDAANGNIGIRWHECGTSIISEVSIIECGIAIQALGCIGSTVRDCYIKDCTSGVLFKTIPIGTPSSVDDITVTASPLALNPNISKIDNIWFTGVTDESIRIEGGLVKVTGCTFQSCGVGGTSHIINLVSANESFDYGGGPIIEGNWMEGGNYLYGICVSSTRAVRIRDNFISGSNTASATKEGAILLSNADNAIVEGNSIRGIFDKTPSGGRLANAAIYVTPNSRAYSGSVDDNYYTKSSVSIYIEGSVMPAILKRRKPEWATITISAAVATIQASSSNFISSLTRAGIGAWVVTYAFNREVITAGQYPVIVTPHSASQTKGYMATVYTETVSNDRINFFTNANVQEDPTGFTIYMFGEYQGN